jgi:large subunit ribosomal protein L10
MVSKKKIEIVKEVKEQIEKYPVIGMLNMFKLPARQLHEIRGKLKGQAVIRMVKKRLIKLIFKETGLSELESYIHGEPALLFSKIDPFKLARIIQSSKSPTLAKPGDIAPKDVVIKAGPTSLSPGPVIGELQKAGLPVGVEGERIVVKKDTVIVKEGEEIKKDVADVLSKFGIKPIEIGLNLTAVWDHGIIYPKDLLFIPVKEYLEKIKHAHSQAFNLSININYFTKENIQLLLSNADSQAYNLAIVIGILTKETIKPLLFKAYNQAMILKKIMEV